MNIQMFALKSASLLTVGAALWIGSAVAAPLQSSYSVNSGVYYEPVTNGGTPTEEAEFHADPAPNLRRQLVNYPIRVAAGTVIINTAQTYLYFVLGDDTAIRYGMAF